MTSQNAQGPKLIPFARGPPFPPSTCTTVYILYTWNKHPSRVDISLSWSEMWKTTGCKFEPVTVD